MSHRREGTAKAPTTRRRAQYLPERRGQVVPFLRVEAPAQRGWSRAPAAQAETPVRCPGGRLAGRWPHGMRRNQAN